MHYYMLQPDFTPDGGYSIDFSMGDQAVSNIVESAYWAIQSEVNIDDKRITKEHDDFFIFHSIDSLEKAADILQHYEIQFKTNIVQKASEDKADLHTEQAHYKVIVPEQPNIDGANVVGQPPIFTEE